MMIDLNGKWEGVCLKDGVPEFTFTGNVPGCVHTDLMGTRIPGDLQYRDNTEEAQWIEDRDWEYRRSFALDAPMENAELVFEGLDTYADIFLDGQKLGSADDMFIRHRFPVAGVLGAGRHELTVRFRSPVREVAGKPARKAAFGTPERLYTRRVQCTYGWDWVARFVTCGIWRDVYLESRTGFRVENAYIYTESIYPGGAQIVVEAEFAGFENGGFADLEILDPDGRSVYRRRVFRREGFLKEYIDLPDARLWYPAGYGAQPLYTLVLCGKRWRFGIRAVSIRQLPDAPGTPYHDLCLAIKQSPSGEKYDHNEEFSGFQLVVNGLPIMCKGANWVPSEPFPSAETPEKQTAILELAREAGLNMLRVWGGGIFESRHFYDECDRQGILVTQDFLMACGSYPEDDPSFLAKLRRETEFAALELRNHPCLVWWSGDNENAVHGSDDMEDYRGRTAIHEGIAPVLSRLDPRRRFLASSPFGGKTYASKTVGTTHNTQYLGAEIFPYIMQTEMADYKEFFSTLLARFIAEEPTCGATCLPSLKKFMTEEDIFGSDAMWQYHTKSNPALSFTLFDMQLRFAQKILGPFADGHDRFFKLKYCQYEWIRVSMENIRRNRGFVNGIVYWMWNDCWAASSGWSFVDYYCLPKASFYSFKRCAGQLLASIDRRGGFRIHLCNDSLTDKTMEVKVFVLGGETVYEGQCAVSAASSRVVAQLPADVLPEGGMLICDVQSGALRDRAFWRAGNLPLAPCNLHWERSGDTVTLWADEYVHAAELEGEYIFSDNYFSLLPGEKRTVTCRPCGTDDTITVQGYTVL